MKVFYYSHRITSYTRCWRGCTFYKFLIYNDKLLFLSPIHPILSIYITSHLRISFSHLLQHWVLSFIVINTNLKGKKLFYCISLILREVIWSYYFHSMSAQISRRFMIWCLPTSLNHSNDIARSSKSSRNTELAVFLLMFPYKLSLLFEVTFVFIFI